MNSAVRYLLTVCLLLTAGIGYTTHAHIYQRHTGDVSAGVCMHALGGFHKQASVGCKTTLSGSKEELLGGTENEDGDFVFARKHTLVVKSLLLPLYTVAAIRFSNSLNRRSELYKYLTYSPSSRYLTHRVLKL